MATKLGFSIESSLASKHLTDAKYIKGGFCVVDTIAERDALVVATETQDGTIVDGSECFCRDDRVRYVYDGINHKWVVKSDNALLAICAMEIDCSVSDFYDLKYENLSFKRLDKGHEGEDFGISIDYFNRTPKKDEMFSCTVITQKDRLSSSATCKVTGFRINNEGDTYDSLENALSVGTQDSVYVTIEAIEFATAYNTLVTNTIMEINCYMPDLFDENGKPDLLRVCNPDTIFGFKVSYFNRKPLLGEIFNCDIFTKKDNLQGSMSAKVIGYGYKASAPNVHLASLEAIEIVPTSGKPVQIMLKADEMEKASQPSGRVFSQETLYKLQTKYRAYVERCEKEVTVGNSPISPSYVVEDSVSAPTFDPYGYDSYDRLRIAKGWCEYNKNADGTYEILKDHFTIEKDRHYASVNQPFAHIKDNYWWIGDTNTNVSVDENAPRFENGYWRIGATNTYVDNKSFAPFIVDGKWWIGSIKTSFSASGLIPKPKDGKWWIGDTDTNIQHWVSYHSRLGSVAVRTADGNVRTGTPRDSTDCVNLGYANGKYAPSDHTHSYPTTDDVKELINSALGGIVDGKY